MLMLLRAKERPYGEQIQAITVQKEALLHIVEVALSPAGPRIAREASGSVGALHISTAHSRARAVH